MRNRILVVLLATVLVACNSNGQQLVAGQSEYTPLVVPADSIGTCVSGKSVAKNGKTLAFEVPLSVGGDRSIRLVEFPSGEVRYMELASSNDIQNRIMLTGIFGRVDSAGGVTGFRQTTTKTGNGDPVSGMKPLTVSEKKRIPLLINWIRTRCGNQRTR